MFVSSYSTQNSPYFGPMPPWVSPNYGWMPYQAPSVAPAPSTVSGDNTMMPMMLMALLLKRKRDKAASLEASQQAAIASKESVQNDANYNDAVKAFEGQKKALGANIKKLNKYLKKEDKEALNTLEKNTSVEAVTAEVDKQLAGQSVDPATRKKIIAQALRDIAEELKKTNTELDKSHKEARKKYKKAKKKAKKKKGKWKKGWRVVVRAVVAYGTFGISELKFLKFLPWNKNVKNAKHSKVGVNKPNESMFSDIVKKAIADNPQPPPVSAQANSLKSSAENPWSTASPYGANSLGQTTTSSQDALKQLFIQQMFAAQAPTSGNAYSAQALYPQSAFL